MTPVDVSDYPKLQASYKELLEYGGIVWKNTFLYISNLTLLIILTILHFFVADTQVFQREKLFYNVVPVNFDLKQKNCKKVFKFVSSPCFTDNFLYWEIQESHH